MRFIPTIPQIFEKFKHASGNIKMKEKIFRSEKSRVILFFLLLTVILTWPAAQHFFSAVPSLGSDTMQVIGVAGDRANFLSEHGLIRGSFELAKRSEFNIVTLYSYFFLIFGRIAGYNILFFLSFVLSGLGVYLLALYFTKNKKAAIIAGIIYAFSPFHIHNALGTNVGTMHQEWLPFFALYLFRFFEKFKLKYAFATGAFFLLIGFTEHQLLAFTAIFLLFFLIYKLIVEPRKFLNKKLWICFLVLTLLSSIVFFFVFRNLLRIATSDNNFLDAGFKSAVKYSNDTLSIFVTPAFHSLWPGAFEKLRGQFERKSSSTFSVFAGYGVLLLSLLGTVMFAKAKKSDNATRGIFFWLAIMVGFYVLSLGPYLHYKGLLDPPVKMPYYLVYQYLPFYKNIRTVGRMFIYSTLAFSLLAAWGLAFLENQFFARRKKVEEEKNIAEEKPDEKQAASFSSHKSKILYAFSGIIIIIEFLAVPLKTNSLLHSSFYEKLGKDREKYNVLEIPGSTSYDFASRDLVWKSIHRKNTINGYAFARVNKEGYTFQRGTPIIRTLLYDIPEGNENQNDKDLTGSSYYRISNEILNYYNIRYIILDHEGLRGDPEKNEPDKFYSARAYIRNVVKCASEYEDGFLYACEADRNNTPHHMFFSMDYSNKHWVGKDKPKDGIRRWAEHGAGLKLVNMNRAPREGEISLSVRVYRPLNLKLILNGEVIYQKYLTQITSKINITTDRIKNIKPGENDLVFDIRGADGSEIHSEKKSDIAIIYNVDIKEFD